ncbi:hypothetical protein [Streptomyces similanensis]|uniref:Tail assembly chaperone n=1 Tax=Streptomyces similanensis TaxID=1274988 RepID=A0ABP9L8F0_9ACTN
MSFVIDLDAERREVQYPSGIPVKLRGEQFIFPAELPMDTFDPLLSEDLNLFGVLSEALEATEGDVDTGTLVMLVLRRNARLPKAFLDAFRQVYALLLGDQHESFARCRPSIGDYVRLTTALAKVYGVDLGKLFRSADSSESASETSSPTSPATTDSTPAPSGSAPDSPDSSASAG